jgi:dipeptidyl aminopeptidase/acylaminoacyl peptidase
MRTTVEILAVLFGGYLVLLGLMLSFQERLAFPAPKSPLPEPQAVGISDAESITVTTNDGVTLRGWYLHPSPPPPDGQQAPGLLWFYGNMETVGALAPLVRELRPPGTAVVMLDYRGYGTSDGRPTEPGLYLDAEAAWEYLAAREEVDSTRISVYGRSLGSASALSLTENHPVRSVILDSPYTNARDMTAKHYWYMPRFLLRLRLDNLTRARALRVPLLVFHGADDDIVPVWMGQAVAEAAADGKLVTFEGAGHNDIYDVAGSRYREEMLAFLQGR